MGSRLGLGGVWVGFGSGLGRVWAESGSSLNSASQDLLLTTTHLLNNDHRPELASRYLDLKDWFLELLLTRVSGLYILGKKQHIHSNMSEMFPISLSLTMSMLTLYEPRYTFTNSPLKDSAYHIMSLINPFASEAI